jgi:type IV pilus assembly protein PilC
MVDISLFLRHYALTMLVIFVVAMITSWLLLKKHQRLKARLEYGMLKLPLIGRLIIFANLAQCLTTFSSCLKGGMNTTDSLQCAVEAMTSPAIKQQFQTLPSLVKNGFAAHTAFSQFAITPAMVTQLLKIGEETGQFIPMLTTCDDQLRQQVNQTVDRLTSLLEPIIISWIGLIVGSLVISMYLPIFNLMSAMG